MWWWWTVARASECAELEPKRACTCEQQRAQRVGAALAEAGAGALRRLSEPAWRLSAQSTCTWAETLGDCAPTICAGLVADDRLATVSSTAPGARAADLVRETGRLCAQGDKRCATEARTAEEERLVEVVDALIRLGLGPIDAQRDWHVYRDGACDAEATAGDTDRGAWARAACGAVLAARRTALLATLGSLRDPEIEGTLADVRWKTAWRHLHPHRRPWAAWLRATGDDPDASALVREAVEARVDGALFPPLVSTEAWTRCEAPGTLPCLEAVHAETAAALAEVRPGGPDPVETAWRTGWCGDRTDAAREACEAEVDFIVADELRRRGSRAL